MRSIVVLALLLLPVAAIAKPPELAPPAPAKVATSSAAIAPSSGPMPAPAPLRKLSREQAARLDAALMHAAAIEKAYSEQIAKDEASFIEEAKDMCKAGGFTLDELVHKRVSVNFKTGDVTRAPAPPAEPSK